MLLCENISDAKNSINIAEIKSETEIIFALCESISNIDGINPKAKDMILEVNILDAITAYYLSPELDILKRIPFVQGVLFASNTYPIYNSIPCFKDISIEEKIALLINGFNIQINNDGDIDKNELYYMHLGIEMKLKLYEQYNNRHKGKK